MLERIGALEKVVGEAERPLVEQVRELEALVEALVARAGAQQLDFTRLAALLPGAAATAATAAPLSRETKTQIIEARAPEILRQTQAVPIGNPIGGPLSIPCLEVLDLGERKGEISACINDFDETSQRSLHAARIYLGQLNILDK